MKENKRRRDDYDEYKDYEERGYGGILLPLAVLVICFSAIALVIILAAK